MSCFTAGQVQFGGAARSTPLAAALPASRAITLAGVARSVSPVRTVRQLDASWAAVDRMLPGHGSALRLLAPEPYESALDLTAQARSLAPRDRPSADRLAGPASTQLRAALAAGALELGRRERLAVADAVVSAARRLGYHVRTSAGQRTTVVEARRDHEVVVVAVTDGGGIEVDHVDPGRPGDHCRDHHRAIEQELARLGIELGEVRRTAHPDRPRGGLIAVAARRGDGDLARAVVREREAPLFSRRTTSVSTVEPGRARRG